MGADLNSTSSDIYHQIDNNETKTHYERRLDSFPVISKNSGNIILDTEKNIATILLPAETKQQTEVLSEDFKQEFIEKLKKLPDFEGSKLKEVIEKGELKIVKTKPVSFQKQKFEIQVNDSKYALYEKGGNLLYFVELNGDKYFNVDGVRKGIAGGGIESGVELFFGGKQVLEDGIYNIYIGDEKIDIKSEEYRKILLICGAEQILFLKELKELYEQTKGWN